MTATDVLQWTQISAVVVSSFSSCVAALVTLHSVNKFKRETTHKENREVARRLMRATLTLRDALAQLRGSIMVSGEWQDRKHGEDEADKPTEEIQLSDEIFA